MIQQQEMQEQVIRILLNEICKRYITDASIFPIILSNDAKQIENLKLVDSLQQSVLTSLRFGQYRRAVWYLQAFSRTCEKTFADGNRNRVARVLQKRIMLELKEKV